LACLLVMLIKVITVG